MQRVQSFQQHISTHTQRANLFIHLIRIQLIKSTTDVMAGRKFPSNFFPLPSDSIFVGIDSISHHAEMIFNQCNRDI